mmetsp:Transcript_29891/g.96936  ORF Transcript_29891/g.96936 Transcript_29891/m.96936 type:complete len:624 (+) Transcript_29891:103-1974(+)
MRAGDLASGALSLGVGFGDDGAGGAQRDRMPRLVARLAVEGLASLRPGRAVPLEDVRDAGRRPVVARPDGDDGAVSAQRDGRAEFSLRRLQLKDVVAALRPRGAVPRVDVHEAVGRLRRGARRADGQNGRVAAERERGSEVAVRVFSVDAVALLLPFAALPFEDVHRPRFIGGGLPLRAGQGGRAETIVRRLRDGDGETVVAQRHHAPEATTVDARRDIAGRVDDRRVTGVAAQDVRARSLVRVRVPVEDLDEAVAARADGDGGAVGAHGHRGAEARVGPRLPLDGVARPIRGAPGDDARRRRRRHVRPPVAVDVAEGEALEVGDGERVAPRPGAELLVRRRVVHGEELDAVGVAVRDVDVAVAVDVDERDVDGRVVRREVDRHPIIDRGVVGSVHVLAVQAEAPRPVARLGRRPAGDDDDLVDARGARDVGDADGERDARRPVEGPAKFEGLALGEALGDASRFLRVEDDVFDAADEDVEVSVAVRVEDGDGAVVVADGAVPDRRPDEARGAGTAVVEKDRQPQLRRDLGDRDDVHGAVAVHVPRGHGAMFLRLVPVPDVADVKVDERTLVLGLLVGVVPVVRRRVARRLVGHGVLDRTDVGPRDAQEGRDAERAHRRKHVR